MIRAVSTVETEPFAGVPAAADRPGWPELRQHGRERQAARVPAADRADHGDRGDLGRRHRRYRGRPDRPDEAAAAISARVREHVTYLPGATGVRTNAQEAWDKGQGVCQDMAQIAVSLLRAAGLPARYVSGYLHPDPKAQPGSTSVGQSHAWVEYWAGSWTALDPTSGAPVGERHVAVARGRDYADVPPLKGIYHGPPEQRHAGHGRGHPPRLSQIKIKIRVSNGRVAPHPSSTHSAARAGPKSPRLRYHGNGGRARPL